MEIVNGSEKLYTLRLDRGEELKNTVEKFCAEQQIFSAWVNALGSCGDLELAYYNLDSKEYETKKFKERLEVLTAVGNVALKDERPFLHAHGTFGNTDMEVVGGHINRCVVSATFEVAIVRHDSPMGRAYDEATGLHILCKL